MRFQSLLNKSEVLGFSGDWRMLTNQVRIPTTTVAITASVAIIRFRSNTYPIQLFYYPAYISSQLTLEITRLRASKATFDANAPPQA